MTTFIIESAITCPHCDNTFAENMPTDSCQYFWQCPNCNEVIKPKPGDCCVFCSYAETPCPPVQKANDCCH
ncbi:MAG: GDCCVxC domain-containing (seleno)protein [Balneolales bacterium]